MDLKSVLDFTVSYGLGTVLAIAITIAGWRLLIYVLQENSKREERLANIIEIHLNKMDTSVNNMQLNVQELKEANKLQREEHKAMMENLSQITQVLKLLEQRIENIVK